jgi:shikimate dehydrogenase
MKKLNTLISNKNLIIKTKKYTSIIGLFPSKGARSPKLWNRAFKKYGIKNEMVPFDVKIKNLPRLMKYLNKDQNFIGGCVTVPYKERIFKLLKNNITKTSKKIGAVNCLFRNKRGQLFGTNTDGEAALKSFENKFGRVKYKNILLLGPGGAGKAVASYFSKALKKNKMLTIVGRSSDSKKFAKKIGAKWQTFKNISKIKFNEIDVIINCTSIGFLTKKNNSPISKNLFKNLNKNVKIFDIIYQPKETKLIKLAKKKKLKTLNGLDMNLIQAVLAFGYTNKKLGKNNLTKKYMKSF